VIRFEGSKPEVVYIGLPINTIIVDFLPGLHAPRCRWRCTKLG